MHLKVLSLNILEGGLFFNNIVELIKREQPDIFCLQEVYNGVTVTLPPYYQTINTLKTAFPEYSYAFAPEFLSITVEGEIEEGNAVFSKFPITKNSSHFFKVPYGKFPQVSPVRDYSVYPCNLQHCEIDANGTKINVFNVHGIWGTDGSDNPARLQMSKVITNEVKGKKHALLMGDFNVQPETKTIQNIEHHMTNIFKGELKTTFNVAHKDLTKYPGYATAVVDMFFISKDLTVVNKSVPNDDVSDHLPLICELEFE